MARLTPLAALRAGGLALRRDGLGLPASGLLRLRPAR